MKIYLCVTIAQEIDGKNTMIRIDKASLKKETVESFIANHKIVWAEKMPVAGGLVEFACERHPQEVEVEE
jgi:hypothetical protein